MDTWESAGQIEDVFVFALAVDSDDRVWAGTQTNGIFRSDDSGETWNHVFFKDFSVIALAAGPGGTIYMGSSGDGQYRSPDGGVTWIQLTFPSPVFWAPSLAVSPLGSVFLGSNLVFLHAVNNGPGVWRSTDGGNSWEGRLVGDDPYPRLVAVNSEGHVFANPFRGLDRSTDNGDTWTRLSGAPPDILTLAFDCSQNVYAGTPSGKVFVSRNNGDNWIELSSWSNKITSISITPGGIIYVAVWFEGIFVSRDRGLTWTEANSGLTSLAIGELIVDSKGRLYVGTHGNGVFRTVQVDTSEAIGGKCSPVRPLPESFALAQNFPNPFNPSTTIEYQLPTAGRVTLKVYDVLGREVATLVDREQETGYYDAVWDAQNSATGVYFYRVAVSGNDASRFSSIKKMVLMK